LITRYSGKSAANVFPHSNARAADEQHGILWRRICAVARFEGANLVFERIGFDLGRCGCNSEQHNYRNEIEAHTKEMNTAWRLAANRKFPSAAVAHRGMAVPENPVLPRVAFRAR
jgi:hypothetical protein